MVTNPETQRPLGFLHLGPLSDLLSRIRPLSIAPGVAGDGRDRRLALGPAIPAGHRRDRARLRSPLPGSPKAFTVLLYHSPDLFPPAAELGIDLHLAGHTHGGQLRLPLFGAIVTSSAFWKRYEAGLYRRDGATLYVSRGIGVEGKGAPRARFLAPPEVVLVVLRSAIA